ncbi:CaiB/BaiF CoA transferase family protein [Martelella mediterranea]|uniref:Formyl-coenzyme A transferase n=1 Tax=Martelella mediterranea DSM 17316 TaxID=1122214 RepID=A0A1U9YWL3_9HYPH|nr:CoA transferase [Martelella mediterranea]AQZ49814.1 Formyl-coenzyme A transferase [Martelella mediterranea DSM 17316]
MMPFERLRVIDATHVLAGPFAAYQMAVMGADVIKIDRPGDPDQVRLQGPDRELSAAGMGTTYLAQGANKRSAALDLKTAGGQEALKALLKDADVFIENYRPGALAALGLGYQDIARINPRIVYCSVSAFGQTGPRGPETGYDFVFQAVAGLMALTGTEESGPLRAGAPVVDYATGYMTAFAITAALYHRERTGRGQHIDLAMFDATLMLMSTHVTALTAGGKPPHPEGNRFNVAGVGAYDTADGLLMLGAANMRQQKRLWLALGRPDMVKTAHADRIDAHAEEAAVLREAMLTRTASDWEAFFRHHGVPAGKVRPMEEALADPQLNHRGVLQPLPQPLGRAGEYRVPVAPFLMSESNPTVRSPPPALGQHTREVLAEAGIDDGRIAALISEGAAVQAL